jgi:3-deoxy-D-manno-octulosonate 8-phosphate phosphatase (KDO 8-P phosphatase)
LPYFDEYGDFERCDWRDTMIKLFFMDVDGTLTDGQLHIGPDGESHKSFNVKDGVGIKMLRDKGIILGMLTARESPIVSRRAEELGITEVYQGAIDKLATLKAALQKYGIKPEEAAYIGDDINDLAPLEYVGLAFVPHDCAYLLKQFDFIQLKRDGGRGAVREAAEIILKRCKDF